MEGELKDYLRLIDLDFLVLCQNVLCWFLVAKRKAATRGLQKYNNCLR